MVKITIGKIKYRLPTTWNEINIEDIVNCVTPSDFLHSLGKIPIHILKQLSDFQLFSLYQIINFIDDENAIEEYINNSNLESFYYTNENLISKVVRYFLTKRENSNEFNIKDITILEWEKFEEARSKITDSLYKTLYEISKVYYPQEKITVRQFYLGRNILNQITLFLEHYSDMLNEPASNEEIQAGIEGLSVFGIWSTAFNLSGRDLLKMEEVLKKSTIEVYTALYYSFKERKYMDALNNIRHNKK